MRNTFLFTVLFIISPFGATVSSAADIPGAREPLTFRNSALYCGWNEYLTRADTPFDFLLVQGNGPYEGRDNSEWNEWLMKARRNGKRVIALLNPQVKMANGEYYNISTCPSDEASLDALVRVMSEFLEQVDVKQLYAVSLSEEHIFWNGEAERLNALYDKLKAKYDVPVYQWYSPSSEGSVPGLNWPNLKADGWLADEYFLDQPFMERAMRGFTVLQKPIIQTIWAGGEKASVPFIPTRFWGQVDACQKYNIPTSFFTWYGASYPWGFSEDAPASLKKTFETSLQAATRAKSTIPPDHRAWDFVPWTIPTIKLAFASKDDRTASFHEEYVSPRGVRFANDADVKGFANLRWDSSPVELRPRQSGKAKASVSYALESPFDIAELRVKVDGFTSLDRSGVLSLTVRDPGGSPIETANLTQPGTQTLTVPGGKLKGRRFTVVYEMSGTAESAGDVLAGVRSLDVTADLKLPADKAIELELDAVGNVAYEEDLSAMRIYQTAEFKNLQHSIHSTSGLHALVPGGMALEVMQKFRVPQKVGLTALRVRGTADETGRAAKLGIGVSLNGKDILARKMSEGSFSGEMKVDLADVAEQVRGTEFVVHLYLEGGHGVITSYAIDGTVAK